MGMQRGRIVRWNDARGFGFIRPEQGGDDVFVHVSSFRNPARRALLDQIVIYTPSRDRQGRLRANRVLRDGDSPMRRAGDMSLLSFLFAGSFVTLIGWLAATHRLPNEIVVVYAVLTLLTFLFHALDKQAARNGDWRVSERTLLLLGLAGGWPGGLLAQNWLRHKSRKPSFQRRFRVTVTLHCLALGWLLLAPGGATYLRHIEGLLAAVLR